MAKTQTRRSVSLNRDVYDRAQNLAIAAGISIAKFVEAALEERLKKHAVGVAIAKFVDAAVDDASEPVGGFAFTPDTEIQDVDASEPDDGVRVEYDDGTVTP